MRAAYAEGEARPRPLVPDYPCARPLRPAPSGEEAFASGVIGLVDLDNMLLVVRSADGLVRFRVTSRTEITLDGAPARFAQLEPGMRVSVAYDPATQTALRISAASLPAPTPATSR